MTAADRLSGATGSDDRYRPVVVSGHAVRADDVRDEDED